MNVALHRRWKAQSSLRDELSQTVKDFLKRVDEDKSFGSIEGYITRKRASESQESDSQNSQTSKTSTRSQSESPQKPYIVDGLAMTPDQPTGTSTPRTPKKGIPSPVYDFLESKRRRIQGEDVDVCQ